MDAKKDPLTAKRKAEWANNNRERVRDMQRSREAENPQCRIDRAARFKELNPGYAAERSRRKYQENPEIFKEKVAKRRAEKIKAMPLWARDEIGLIRRVYEEASIRSSESGNEWHVDHIVPLRGKTVCGLHCLANLQILPGHENRRKNNRVWPDMPE